MYAALHSPPGPSEARNPVWASRSAQRLRGEGDTVWFLLVAAGLQVVAAAETPRPLTASVAPPTGRCAAAVFKTICRFSPPFSLTCCGCLAFLLFQAKHAWVLLAFLLAWAAEQVLWVSTGGEGRETCYEVFDAKGLRSVASAVVAALVVVALMFGECGAAWRMRARADAKPAIRSAIWSGLVWCMYASLERGEQCRFSRRLFSCCAFRSDFAV